MVTAHLTAHRHLLSRVPVNRRGPRPNDESAESASTQTDIQPGSWTLQAVQAGCNLSVELAALKGYVEPDAVPEAPILCICLARFGLPA